MHLLTSRNISICAGDINLLLLLVILNEGSTWTCLRCKLIRLFLTVILHHMWIMNICYLWMTFSKNMFHPKIVLCNPQWCSKDVLIIYYQLIWPSEHSLVIFYITTIFLSRPYVMMIFYIYFQTNHMLPGGYHEGHAITGDSGLLRLPVYLVMHAASTLAGLINDLYWIS